MMQKALLLLFCAVYLWTPVRSADEPADLQIVLWHLHSVDSDKQSEAIAELVKIGAPAFQPLTTLLTGRQIHVRVGAIRALGQMKDERAVPIINPLLTDPLSEIRIEAAIALGILAHPASIDPLIRALQDTHPAVRESAVHALGILKATQAIEPLSALLADPQPAVKVEVVRVLAQMKDDRIVPMLQPLLAEPLAKIRIETTLALSIQATPACIEPLIRALRDTHPMMREYAAHALGNLNAEQASQPLCYLLNDIDYYVRLQAAIALEKVGDEKAVKPLLEAVNDPYYAYDRSLRVALLSALARLRDMQALPVFINLLSRPDTDDKQMKIAVDGIVESSLTGLSSKDSTQRRQAAHMFSIDAVVNTHKGDERLIMAILPLLKDPDRYMRLTAIPILRRLGNERLIGPFIEAYAEEDDNAVRAEFYLALASITHERFANDPAIWTAWWKKRNP